MKKYEENKNSLYTYQENEIYPFYADNIDTLTPKGDKQTSRNEKIVFYFYLIIYIIYIGITASFRYNEKNSRNK